MVRTFSKRELEFTLALGHLSRLVTRFSTSPHLFIMIQKNKFQHRYAPFRAQQEGSPRGDKTHRNIEESSNHKKNKICLKPSENGVAHIVAHPRWHQGGTPEGGKSNRSMGQFANQSVFCLMICRLAHTVVGFAPVENILDDVLTRAKKLRF